MKGLRLTVLAPIGIVFLSLCACDRTTTPSTPTPTPDPVAAFTGVWRSTVAADACTALNWSVAPVNATTATIVYTTTCAGVPVSGTANGTVSGTTMNWSATGTAAATCAYAINGTATPAATATDLNVTYTGNVCGTPVRGSDTLHR